MGVCNCSMYCCTLLYVHYSIAIILMGKRELIALLNLSSWCLVMVVRLFLTVPRGCLQFVIVVFPDHTHLLFMIRSYCFDTEKDWDEGIHLLLFAVRESVQESLGFSPFELVFGHTVRGPLKLLKEKFLSDDDSSLN